jgi:hypothetical protein
MGSAIVGLSDTPLSAGAPPNQAECSDRTWDCDRERNGGVLKCVYVISFADSNCSRLHRCRNLSIVNNLHRQK